MTLVLYFGTERHWSEPKALKETFSIPEGMNQYINDYKINVFEVAWLTDEEICRFKSDFRVVANFFSQKRRNPDYVPDDPQEIEHVDAVLKLLSVMTGDVYYENILTEKGVKEVKSMCDVAQRLVNTGRAEGLAEGAEITLYELVQDGDLSAEKAAKRLNITTEQLKTDMRNKGYVVI